MADDKKQPSIFTKAVEAGQVWLDSQIFKAKSQVMNEVQQADFDFGKAVTEDPSYAINAAGWKEKPHRLQDGHLKQMSIKNSVIAAVIQTRQNQVANHSKLVKSEKERGWMLCLRDEEELLEKIKEELQAEMEVQSPDEEAMDIEKSKRLRKAIDEEMGSGDSDLEEMSQDPAKDSQSDDQVEAYNWELERKAKEKLESQYKAARKKVQDYLINCGEDKDKKPFEYRKWNFDSALRAWVRDSLTYDRYATEIVPNQANKPSYFFPVDGATIKFASNRLKDYKQVAENFLNLDILYPEKRAEAMEKQKVLDLDEELLAADMYKYVQVIRGKIERAYTEDELKIGIRNQTTDIYNNGYGVSELELVVSLVTGHLNAEFYNQAYFTQGFSAKGILHIKAAINRRKLETVRQQWQHMIRGARNSFQTPIFAGLEDVEWIPLTQNHQDIGFEGWMRYLIKMICAIYQIDPHEIGIGFKDEGGAGMSGDNTKEKMDQSKDKGLYPLLRHIENYINEEILKPYDDRFILKFTGVTAETQAEALERQDIERKFKKTLNEVREEDGLPPMPGGDEIILGPEFVQIYLKKMEMEQAEKMAAQGMGPDGKPVQPPGSEDDDPMADVPEDSLMHDGNLESNLISPEDAEDPAMKSIRKSKKPKQVKIEYYKLED